MLYVEKKRSAKLNLRAKVETQVLETELWPPCLGWWIWEEEEGLILQNLVSSQLEGAEEKQESKKTSEI